MKSLLEPEFRPLRLDVKEYHLRSALCTSQQVFQLKGSAEFTQWCETQRIRKQRRQQAGTLLQCVLAVSLLLLGYNLAKPQVSSPNNEITSWYHLCYFLVDLNLLHAYDGLFACQAALLDVSAPGLKYQALAAQHAPANLISTQPMFQFQGKAQHSYETTDVPSFVDIAAVESMTTTSIAQPEKVLLAESARQSSSVRPHLEDGDELPEDAHNNRRTDTGGLKSHVVADSSQHGSPVPDAGVTRCDLDESVVY